MANNNQSRKGRAARGRTIRSEKPRRLPAKVIKDIESMLGAPLKEVERLRRERLENQPNIAVDLATAAYNLAKIARTTAERNKHMTRARQYLAEGNKTRKKYRLPPLTLQQAAELTERRLEEIRRQARGEDIQIEPVRKRPSKSG